MLCVRRLMVEGNLQGCKPSFSSDKRTNRYLVFADLRLEIRAGLLFIIFSILPKNHFCPELGGKGAVIENEIIIVHIYRYLNSKLLFRFRTHIVLEKI